MAKNFQARQQISWVSAGIVILYIAMFQWERQALHMGLLEYLIRDYSFHWQSFLRAPLVQCPHLFSYTFLHADVVHLVSNGIFFFLLSFLLERFIGSIQFTFLYISGGAVAAVAQGFFDPYTSGLIGASGAIAAVGGAFFVLAPSYMTFKKHLFFSLILLLWYALEWGQQLKVPSSIQSVSNEIAHGAHLGGFGWGALWGGLHLILTRS